MVFGVSGEVTELLDLKSSEDPEAAHPFLASGVDQHSKSLDKKKNGFFPYWWLWPGKNIRDGVKKVS